MTPDPVVLRHDDPIAIAIHKMAVGGFRHIPIVEDGRPTGVVTARDVFHHLAEALLTCRRSARRDPRRRPDLGGPPRPRRRRPPAAMPIAPGPAASSSRALAARAIAAIVDLTARAYDGIAAIGRPRAAGARVLAVGQHDDHDAPQARPGRRRRARLRLPEALRGRPGHDRRPGWPAQSVTPS